MSQNVLVVHGGGPTAVINASLYGVIEEAKRNPEVGKVYGAIGGTGAIFSETFIDLTSFDDEKLKLLLHTPASAIGSSRYPLYEKDYEKMVDIFKKHDIKYVLLNGGNGTMDACERSLYKFRNGSCHVLISTDLAARGLDIPEIENVVHYHLPANEDGYIHRNGRTARWEAEGNSYVILHAEETVPAYITDEPEEFILPEVTPKPSLPEYVTLYIGKGKKDKINKIDIVGFLFKKGNLNKDEIGRIDVKDHYSFAAVSRKKIKQTLNLIRNEKIKGIKTLIEEAK